MEMLIFKLYLRSSDGSYTTMFGETPIMSPYLLAFAISDFDFTSMKIGRVTHRIYARTDNGADLKTQLALRTSDLFLKELERYVSFEYEMGKLDQVALPDFQSGLFIFFIQKLLVTFQLALKTQTFLHNLLFVQTFHNFSLSHFAFIPLFLFSGAMENWGLITYKYVKYEISRGIFHDECRT